VAAVKSIRSAAASRLFLQLYKHFKTIDKSVALPYNYACPANFFNQLGVDVDES
jgi:hypothetical protein